MATKGEIRLAAKRGKAHAAMYLAEGMGSVCCLSVAVDTGGSFRIPIRLDEALQLRDKGEMDVIVNVRLIPAGKESK